jgi:transmembrane sensor
MNSEFAEPSTPVSEQAAAWLFELMVSPIDRNRHHDFVAWLKRSPQHIESFLAIAVLERELSELPIDLDEALAASGGTGNVLPLETALRDERRRGGERRQGGKRAAAPRRATAARRGLAWVAGAGIAAAALVAALPFLSPDVTPPAAVHQTDYGEQRSIALSDGSIVTLNTRSQVAVHFDDRARRVELVSGEAMFDVVPDSARPFVVETGAVELSVLGTRFSVYRKPDAIRLAVVEGVVRATPREKSGEPLLVRAGEGAIATLDGTIRRNEEIDVEKAIAWTERRLIFDDVPLEDVVSEFNRYNRRPLIIQDPELAGRKITSVFFANDVSALIAFLELEPDVEVDHGADAIRIRSKH